MLYDLYQINQLFIGCEGIIITCVLEFWIVLAFNLLYKRVLQPSTIEDENVIVGDMRFAVLLLILCSHFF